MMDDRVEKAAFSTVNFETRILFGIIEFSLKDKSYLALDREQCGFTASISSVGTSFFYLKKLYAYVNSMLIDVRLNRQCYLSTSVLLAPLA